MLVEVVVTNPKKPMFVFLHAGPALDTVEDSFDMTALSRTLIPRTFLRNLLASRIAVSTLNQIKYVDAKVSYYLLPCLLIVDNALGAIFCV